MGNHGKRRVKSNLSRKEKGRIGRNDIEGIQAAKNAWDREKEKCMARVRGAAKTFDEKSGMDRGDTAAWDKSGKGMEKDVRYLH